MSDKDQGEDKTKKPSPPADGEDEILVEFVDHDDGALEGGGAGPGPLDAGLEDKEPEVEVVLLDGDAEAPVESAAAPPREEASEALAKLEDRHLRLRAEFENYRRRVDRDREEMRRQALASTVSELLPALDNLNLAVKSLEQEVSPDHWKGMLLVLQQLKDSLGRLGLEEIEAVGERFDPSLHEAVNAVVREDVPPMTVTAVYASGYRLGGKVIKPARVEVSRGPEGGSAGGGNA